MFRILLTEPFKEWLDNIKDGMTQRRLVRRLEKVSHGNLGDVKYIDDGVWEMREFFGAGYRMYYIKHGDVIIVMLGGGDKSTQRKDIEQAIALSKTVEIENDEINSI